MHPPLLSEASTIQCQGSCAEVNSLPSSCNLGEGILSLGLVFASSVCTAMENPLHDLLDLRTAKCFEILLLLTHQNHQLPQASSPSPAEVRGGHPESPTDSWGPEAQQEIAPCCGPPGLISVGSPPSLSQALFDRCVGRDPAADRHGWEGKKTSGKGPEGSQNYKASQQQHSHHAGVTQPPAEPTDPGPSQRKPSPSSSSSRSQSCCVCATSTFKAHFYF